MAKSGFQTAVDLSALPPGTYRLRTVYEMANGSGMRLACNRAFRIRIGSRALPARVEITAIRVSDGVS